MNVLFFKTKVAVKKTYPSNCVSLLSDSAATAAAFRAASYGIYG